MNGPLPLLHDATTNLKIKKGCVLAHLAFPRSTKKQKGKKRNAFWDHFSKHTSLQVSVAFDLGALCSKHTWYVIVCCLLHLLN